MPGRQTPPDDRRRATELLGAGAPDPADSDAELLPILYGELRQMASRLLLDERGSHTLQPTALVHEAWFRLIAVDQLPAGSDRDARRRFVALATKAMRRVLIDHARQHKADKRGGNRARVALDESLPVLRASEETLLDLEAALERLAGQHERLAAVAELRVLGGLPMAEIAATLDVSLATVKNDWVFAQALLARWLDSP